MAGFDNIYQYWVSFLTHADPLVGIPMCAFGVMLVLVGWRMWRAIAVFDFALLGGFAGYVYTMMTTGGLDWRWIGGGAVLLAIVAFALHRYTSPVLGGLAGGLVCFLILQTLGFYGMVLWVVAGLGLIAATGWAYSYRQQVEAVLTSAEGGVLLASGFAIMLPEVPILYKFFSSMTATSPFMIGFYILVPTVVGVTMQQADLNRSSSKAATA